MILVNLFKEYFLHVTVYFAIAFIMFHLFRYLLYKITNGTEGDALDNPIGVFGLLICAALWPGVFLILPIIIFCVLCIWSSKYISIKK